MEYSDVIETVAKRYEERALAFLAKIRAVLIEDGWLLTEPHDFSDDVFRWTMATLVDDKVRDGSVDFTVQIAEQREYDGGEGYGINFGLDIVAWGGLILGGIMPYNFTERCWVDARDPVAVEGRFLLLEHADISEVPALMPERTA